MARPIASGKTERGYAMGTLLVALAIMSIMMSMALPRWNQLAKREREAELVFRGEQYARAIDLYQRTYAATFPPDVDVLIDERFLRRRYLDPMTEDGEFRVVYQAEVAELLGNAPTAPLPAQAVDRPASGAKGGNEPEAEANADDRLRLQLSDTARAPGTRGGVAGVVSRSDEVSLRLYNGGTKYSEWAFIYTASAGALGNRPGPIGGSIAPQPPD